MFNKKIAKSLLSRGCKLLYKIYICLAEKIGGYQKFIQTTGAKYCLTDLEFGAKTG